MCEPTHSIVQYPDDDGTQGGRIAHGLGKIYEWAKKFGKFIHVSQFGSGHSESVEWAMTQANFLPDDTKYEAFWWNRTVKLDGSFRGVEAYKAEALEEATRYAYNSSIGNLSMLRRFLETSVKRTCVVDQYKRAFLRLIVQSGKVMVQNALNQCNETTQLIKVMCGFTRKRNLLVPEWADDAKLFIPGQ